MRCRTALDEPRETQPLTFLHHGRVGLPFLKELNENHLVQPTPFCCISTIYCDISLWNYLTEYAESGKIMSYIAGATIAICLPKHCIYPEHFHLRSDK